MTILQQSSNARDRKLSDWYERIRSGQGEVNHGIP